MGLAQFGLDAVDLDMLKRGDMLGPKTGAKFHAAIERLLAENRALIDALTPSGDTKAAYIAEFKFDVEVWDPDGGEDGDGEAVMESTTVPWTTVKEIMAAISRHARQALEDSLP